MFGIEWVVVIGVLNIAGWLIVAGIRAVGDAIVDAVVLARHPKAEAPSLVKRRARAELAQKQAADRIELAELQRVAGVPPAPGQAAADRLARFIANPPPWPPWVIAAASYFGLLLADGFAKLRRQHVANEKARQRGERGWHRRVRGPFCKTCDVNPVRKSGGMCVSCALVVHDECTDCHTYVPVASLAGGRCETCRRPVGPPQPDPDAPLVLEMAPRPSWLPAD